MGEHDIESNGGIPSDGVPSDETVRQEREQWDEGKTVKERIYETALTLREPTPRFCRCQSSRVHTCIRATTPPLGCRDRYRRASWRRTTMQFLAQSRVRSLKTPNEVGRTHSGDELATQLETLLERDRAYQDKYDESDPA
ncbi:hypothetical protein [Halococcus thailandensis]|uniref:hypothetical protein n=1 Tax=Halococcus thailandensis TaxID=335952 RepID=UPI0012681971|nr:hypothetical protein [Halococcus thailandensis]